MRALSRLTAFYAMMALTSGVSETNSGEVTGRKFRVCPKGCNYYRFNSIGKFTVNKEMDFQEYEDCVFECFAINDKSAIKKFKKRFQ